MMSRAEQFGLQNADEMCKRFFDRWYDPVARKIKEFTHTRPDVMQMFEPRYAGEIKLVPDSFAAQALERMDQMIEAAEGDWREVLGLEPPLDLRSVDAFDRYYDRDRADDLARTSDPEDFSNAYVVTVCEFGAVLGKVLVETMPSLQWLPCWPYWETSLLDRETGYVIPPFHWAIKKFSTYGIDDGFAAKVQACVQFLQTTAKDGSTNDL